MKRMRSHIDEIFQPANINRIALLGAFSMFLATLEYLFPKPLPFMRLGLANIPLLLGLEILSMPSYIVLVIIKVLGQALVNGTLASYVFLFSLCGSVGAAFIMQLAYRGFGKRISFIGISLLGALASNLVQIGLSVKFIFGDASWRIMPVFLSIGLVSGFLIGLFTQYFSSVSVWWQAFSGKEVCCGSGGELSASAPGKTVNDEMVKDEMVKDEMVNGEGRKTAGKRRDLLEGFLHPSFRFFCGLILIPAWLFLYLPAAKIIILFIFVVLTIMSGKKIRVLYYLVLLSSITLFNLLTPIGRVIAEIGPLRITSGALETGLMKGVTICGLILISMFSVSGRLRFPGRFGGLLARTFYFFEEILADRGRISLSNFTDSLDRMLLQLFSPLEKCDFQFNGNEGPPVNGKRIQGIIYLVILSLILWGSLVFQFFYS